MEGRVMRVGIVGVGTIGQALAKAIDRGEVAVQLTALHSRNLAQAQAFARTLGRVPEVVDLAGVLTRCDLVIEAATQAALAWLLHQGEDVVPIPGTTSLEHLEENLGACDIHFTEEDFNGIAEILKKFPVAGTRYNPSMARMVNLD